MRLATTSYRAYRPEMGQIVVTSRGLPRWLLPESRTWPRLWLATPSSAYKDAPADEFAEQYTAQLDRAGADRIRAALADIAGSHEATRLVLACFEAKEIDCHRALFRCWWHAATGEEIEELT
jgi:Protein of unknown function, DUF488